MRLDRLVELLFHKLCHLAVILLARALQQRMISGVLNERVLEYVARTVAPATLVEQLVLDELTEFVLQDSLLARCE